MILSTSYFIKTVLIYLAVFIGLALGAGTGWAENAGRKAAGQNFKIAIFPVLNISGSPAPLQYIRRLLEDKLKASGETVIDEDVLENTFAKHRIRYIGGLDSPAAVSIKQETGADVALITSLEHYSDVVPPKISLTSRLVTTGHRIRILWMEGVGLAGDESPGLLDLGLIDNPDTLLEMALEQILDALTEFLSTGQQKADLPTPRGKHRPRVIFRSPVLNPALPYVVAVMPFLNFSERKFAGEIMDLHFVRQMAAQENLTVIEPGVVRQALLRGRIIMGDGISMADAGLMARLLSADLILSGKVMNYQDFQGRAATPRVDFSAEIMEKNSNEVVWAVQSYNRGNDGVFFFDWGRVNTAFVMASEMVQLAVENMVAPE